MNVGHGYGGFPFFRGMESEAEALPTTGWVRPRPLARLCIASFIDQGVFFPAYLITLAYAVSIRHLGADELSVLVEKMYRGLLPAERMQQMVEFNELLREHGVALMTVMAGRTLVRFIGTLRMWQGRRDGFHIYTMAQLLGCLLPILIAGPRMFSLLGFLLMLNWCYLYFLLRKTLRA